MRSFPYFLLLALMLGVTARAEYKKTLYAGRSIVYVGLGFLFNDTTTFLNPGQTSLADGTTLAVSATKKGDVYSGGPIFTQSVETMSLGAFYHSTGSELFSSSPTSSYVGGMLGASLMKGKITVGGAYSQALGSAVQDRSFGVSFNYNAGGSQKMKGMSYGFGLTSIELGAVKNNVVKVGVGRSFSPNNGVEIDYTLNDNRDLGDYTVGAYYVGRYAHLYGSAGYTFYSKRAGDVDARLGVVYGHFDLSATISYPLASGTSSSYGGIFRFLF